MGGSCFMQRFLPMARRQQVFDHAKLKLKSKEPCRALPHGVMATIHP